MEYNAEHKVGLTFAKPFEAYRNKVEKNLYAYVLGHAGTNIILRGRQKTVFEDIQTFVKNGGVEGYIALPTATGKTPLYIKFMEAVIADSDMKAIIAVPTNVLVDQTRKMLYRFVDHAKIETLPNKIGVLNYLHKDYNAPILITTYASLRMKTESGALNPLDYQLLILDEAHEVLTERRTATINKFTNALKLGLTATPEYSEEKKLINILPNEIHRMSIREGVYEGLLSDFSVYIVETQTDLTQVKITSKGNFDEKELNMAVNTSSRNMAALEVYQNLFPDSPPAIANCVTIEHAETLAELANKVGIPAVAVTSLMSEAQRDEALWKYKNGDYKLITNVNILTRGFDAPNAVVCLNLAPTLSEVRATQRSGRVLRLDPEDHERNYAPKHAYVVDFRDKINNKRAIPISFAEIAEDAEIIRSQAKYTIPEIKKEPRERPKIEVEGIKVITDPKLVMRVVNADRSHRLVNAPEGYTDKNEFASMLNVDYRRVGAIINNYGSALVKHPEWVGEYINKNGRPALHYYKDFVEIVKLNYKPLLTSPESWMNREQAEHAIAKSRTSVITTIIKELGEVLKVHPEWSGVYLAKNGMATTFYHPDFIKLVRTRYEQIKIVPEGWKNKYQLKKLTGRDERRIDRVMVEELSETIKNHPNWIKQYKDKNGNITTYYHPKLVALLTARLTRFDERPKGWMAIKSIANKSYTGPAIVKYAIKELASILAAHPEWVGEYLGPGLGGSVMYYHPTFVKLVLTKIKESKPPRKWRSTPEIAGDSGKSVSKISSEIKELSDILEKHPEWKGIYRNELGMEATYYRPKFIKIIGTRIMWKDSPSPTGWLNLHQIAKETKRNISTTKKAIDSLNDEINKHPEWIGSYKTKNTSTPGGNKPTTFYHPDFVRLVEERLLKIRRNKKIF